MPITGVVEEAGQFGIRGWLSRNTPAQFAPLVDIIVNRRLAATVSSTQTEPSRYKFSFNPFETLKPGMNTVELFVSGSDQLVDEGTFSIELKQETRPTSEIELPSLTGDGWLILGSGICEHCFPSVAGTLSRIYRKLKPGGVAVLDFLCAESEMTSSYAVLTEDGTFTRIYSEQELRSFVLDAGFEIIELRQNAKDRVQLQARKPEVTI